MSIYSLRQARQVGVGGAKGHDRDAVGGPRPTGGAYRHRPGWASFVTSIAYNLLQVSPIPPPPVYCEKYQQFLQWNLLVPILHTFYLQLSITIITKIHFVIQQLCSRSSTYENLAKIINIFMQNVVEYGFSFKTINNFFLLLRCRHKENHVTLIF